MVNHIKTNKQLKIRAKFQNRLISNQFRVNRRSRKIQKMKKRNKVGLVGPIGGKDD